MEMHHSTLISRLRIIAKDPGRGWGSPFDAVKGAVNISEILKKKEKLRKGIKQIHINRARLRSKTYSLKQLKEWEGELKKTKSNRPALKFPGDPDRLAGKAPKRICQNCRTMFYSIGERGTTCFRCCLEDSFKLARGTFITSLWWHRDIWDMQGIIDFLRNDISLWWWKNTSDHLCYQALVIALDSKNEATRLSLSTVIKEKNCCYTAVFDLTRNGMAGLWYSNSHTTDVSKHEKNRDVSPEEVDYILKKKMEMLPEPWMTAV